MMGKSFRTLGIFKIVFRFSGALIQKFLISHEIKPKAKDTRTFYDRLKVIFRYSIIVFRNFLYIIHGSTQIPLMGPLVNDSSVRQKNRSQPISSTKTPPVYAIILMNTQLQLENYLNLLPLVSIKINVGVQNTYIFQSCLFGIALCLVQEDGVI